MTASIYRYDMTDSLVGRLSKGLVLSIDGFVVWAGTEDEVQFHIDRHRQLWIYPVQTFAAVLATAFYPERAAQIQEMTGELAENPVFLSKQIMREINDVVVEQMNQRETE